MNTETNALAVQSSDLSAVAAALTVNDDDSYALAGGVQRDIRALKDRIEAFYAPHVKRAHEAWQGLTAERRNMLAPVEAALKDLQGKMGGYQAELERQRREEEAVLRARAVAEAKAEAEAMAEYHEIQGNETEAAAIRAVADTNALHAGLAVQVDSYAPRVEGQTARVNWKFEVTDAGQLPREFLMPDTKAIGAFVRARRGAVQIPGVRVWPEHSVSVKA